MNRRHVLIALAGAAASAVLPGCGLGSLAPSPEPVDLRCAILPGLLPTGKRRQAKKVIEAWAEELHLANDYLSLGLEELAYDDLISPEGAFALDLLLGEDSEYDSVFAASEMVPALLEQKLIASIESYLQSADGSPREDYVAALFDSMLVEGQAWALPVAFNPTVVRYNRGVFAQLGVPEPRIDWTWDEFLETAERLDGAMSDRQFALGLGCGDLLPMIHALGGRMFDDNANPRLCKLDEPATADAFTELASLMGRGILADPDRVQAYEPSREDSEAVQSVVISMIGDAGESEAMAEYQAIADYALRLGLAAANGDVAMWFGSVEEGMSGTLGSVNVFGLTSAGTETGVALLPRGERAATLAGVAAHCLVAASPKQKDTWAWLTLVSGKVPPVGLPPRRSLLLAPESQAELSSEAATVAQALGQRLDSLDIITTPLASMASPVAQALWRAWNGADPREALSWAAAEVQGSLDEAADA